MIQRLQLLLLEKTLAGHGLLGGVLYKIRRLVNLQIPSAILPLTNFERSIDVSVVAERFGNAKP